MKVVFTGAQGTGKTTILNHYKDQGFNVITEVVRNLAKKGVKINQDGDEKGQTKIFNEYKKLLADTPNYFSDRCLLDVTAYTIYLYRAGKVSEDFANKQLKNLHKFMLANPDIFYCYFPIEFDLVDDGTRSMDVDFQKEIDSIILSLIGSLGLGFVVINGSVEDRIAKIDKLMDWVKTSDELFTRLTRVDATTDVQAQEVEE